MPDRMPNTLTRKNLRGVWCALIVPWDDRDEVDEARFRHEVRAYRDKGVNGLYTGGTTGEFYAQDDASFSRISRIACQEAHACGLPVQIGCTTLSTRTAIGRIHVAAEAGADAIQIALPFWLKLSDEEVATFVADIVAAAGPLPVVLYLTNRSKRRIEPKLFGRLAARHPSLIGTKDTACTVAELREMLVEAPDMAIFGGDNDFLTKIPAGGSGGYCSVTGLNARAIVQYYQLCAANRLDEARVIHNQINGLMSLFNRWEAEDGLMDSAGDRIQRVAGGVDVGLACQKPYRSGSVRHVQELLEHCRMNAPDFLPEA